MSGHFTVPPAWRLILKDLGIRPDRVLRRAGLPLTLFADDGAKLDPPAYFRLWRALEAEDGREALPLRIAEALSAGGFEPPLFAALCSPDLNTALTRLARFKALVGPMRLTVEAGEERTRAEVACRDVTEPLPSVLAAFELVFLVQLARLATREPIHPVAVSAEAPLEPADAYAGWLGCRVTRGPLAVSFTAADARRPFLTANDAMWRFFEPELTRQLAALDADASTEEAVRAALMELLPSGRAGVEHAASALGLSPRTLQRRLKREGTTFRAVLDATREKLSLHYVRRSRMSPAEISFLLGFEDPNSFFRAFRQWTGQTPRRARERAKGD
ncbi:MAG TPA: AraC family transcriptional regulator ligand-binding domain-containing protein [Sandaracinaceae bacterium LLY-WYZ-13_1]|nr:AraC family transcriptional regulator ligand-binding domain-containing protein [Sandaracinaceae bacterium LLY-WYZ-13_1]